jgi:hypothetical protein
MNKSSKISTFILHGETKQKHNESGFFQIERDVFILRAEDRHHDTCFQSIQLQNNTNFTT